MGHSGDSLRRSAPSSVDSGPSWGPPRARLLLARMLRRPRPDLPGRGVAPGLLARPGPAAPASLKR
eukprot:8506199-Pyramimonas_sp.AAC.1